MKRKKERERKRASDEKKEESKRYNASEANEKVRCTAGVVGRVLMMVVMMTMVKMMMMTVPDDGFFYTFNSNLYAKLDDSTFHVSIALNCLCCP